uniref:Small ribosomal subunit protein uS14c n=1 Tax=Kumanoa americana TaxID=1196377 RepID=A0A1C9CGE2_9FLOR|nr:ribosomal protein S14 [Kumanoa americana]AOM67439.1 ribosomal protein S14 [Kumanoa americana]
MSKKSIKEREKKRSKLNAKYSLYRLELKKQIKKSNDFDKQIIIQKELQKLPKNSSKIRLRNRCWLTGRSRGFYRDFGLSRHVFREMAHECLLPGITKASW